MEPSNKNVCNLWTLSSSMPPREPSLMSVSARLWQGEFNTRWMVLASAFYQDNSYFSTDRVWMHIDWWEFDMTSIRIVSQDAHLTNCVLFVLSIKIWLCQNLVKLNSQFVKLLVGPQTNMRQTCMFQIKRILGFCCRYSTLKKRKTNV